MISNNPGDLICSPLSAQIVLAMAGYGAGGDTASEMRGVLGVPEDDQLGQEGYKAFMETLNVSDYTTNYYFFFLSSMRNQSHSTVIYEDNYRFRA